jgi:hypothetical protein
MYRGEVVVSGPHYCTHLGCRQADREVEASAADCLQTLVGRPRWKLCSPWRIALDTDSGPEAVQLMCTTSRGPARTRTAASATMGVRFPKPDVKGLSAGASGLDR